MTKRRLPLTGKNLRDLFGGGSVYVNHGGQVVVEVVLDASVTRRDIDAAAEAGASFLSRPRAEEVEPNRPGRHLVLPASTDEAGAETTRIQVERETGVAHAVHHERGRWFLAPVWPPRRL